MKGFWIFLYSYTVIPVLRFVFIILGIFNDKVRKGIDGRKRLFEELILKAQGLDKNRKLVWVHSSSLGEFEQAKPIIEFLKKNYPINILVTFFSPSGYENAKNYPLADITSYIPFDTPADAQKFVDICNPSLALFIRYDLWPNHVYALWKKHIPVFLTTATMADGSMRKSIFARGFHKHLYAQIDKILAITEKDARNFAALIPQKDKIEVVGDTRFDRVYQMSLIARGKNLINPEVIKDKKVVVLGSSWQEDEEVLLQPLLTLLKYDTSILVIIAPHEPKVSHLERVEQTVTAAGFRTLRFSQFAQYDNEPVVLVDSIGILLTLYSYAHLAFVGGSFKSNIHNVLEAAVYGVPVIYGPKIYSSREAGQLAELGGGCIFTNRQECYRLLRTLLSDESERQRRGAISKQFIEDNLGATDKILKHITNVL
ncbi:MAG: 3-deoxy-D-manno-octulosonic acid transferase [Ignavibacteria bacterium]|nr:3-deoxy-D-manno-octulosonic acid transferase [Ignavibacteria bacterium]